jgi:hypothetical protein
VGTAAPGCPGEQSSPAHSAGDASEAGDQLSQAVLGTDGRGRLFPQDRFHPTSHETARLYGPMRATLSDLPPDFVLTLSPPHDKSLPPVPDFSAHLIRRKSVLCSLRWREESLGSVPDVRESR